MSTRTIAITLVASLALDHRLCLRRGHCHQSEGERGPSCP